MFGLLTSSLHLESGAQSASEAEHDAVLVRGEDDSAARRWVERCLTSPLYGALVQVAEGAGLLAGADVVAGRVYGVSTRRPCTYVGTAGLDISPRQRMRLQGWPVAKGSVFNQLEQVGPQGDAVSLGKVLASGDRFEGRRLGPGFEPMLHPACRLSDGFVVTLPVDERCWAALLLLRERQRPRFDPAQRGRVVGRASTLGEILRRGLHAQQPVRPAVSGLLTRLSRTERDVLELLCQDKTEREIATHFGRSPHTVHVHVKSIYRKLTVHSRRELLARVRAASGGEPA